jgi:hypothetical protein
MPGIARATSRDLLLTLLLCAVSVATYLIYPVLNHGPDKIFLQTPLDRAIPLDVGCQIASVAGRRRPERNHRSAVRCCIAGRAPIPSSAVG